MSISSFEIRKKSFFLFRQYGFRARIYKSFIYMLFTRRRWLVVIIFLPYIALKKILSVFKYIQTKLFGGASTDRSKKVFTKDEGHFLEEENKFFEKNYEAVFAETSYRLKYFILHIPKTAGTAISKHILGNFGNSHHPLNVIEIKTGKKIPKDAVCITVVRDPIDRFISAYNHLISISPCPEEFGENINDYVQNPKYLTNTLSTHTHFSHQIMYISPLGLKVKVKEIIPYDRISEVFPDLPKLNTTASKRRYKEGIMTMYKKEDLSVESIKILKEWYKDDIWLYEKLKSFDAPKVQIN